MNRHHRKRSVSALFGAIVCSVALLASACAGASALPGTPAAAAPSAPSAAPTPRPAPTVPPAPTATPGLKRGGTLVFGFQNDITSFDPAFSTSATDYTYFRLLYDSLVGYDPKTVRPEPQLASEWKVTDPVTWEVTLRPGVQFDDGTPVDAAAVKKHLDRVLDPSTASLARSEIAVIKSVEVIDPQRIRITTQTPSLPLVNGFFTRAGMPYSPAAVGKYGKDTKRNPAGAGPFKLTRWEPQSLVELERNPNYWVKDKPYLDRIRVNIIPDTGTLISNLRAGTADVIYKPGLNQVASLQKDPNIQVELVDGMVYTWLGINIGIPPFDNKDLRLAVAQAVDPQELINVANEGIGRPASGGFLFPWMLGYQGKDLPVLSKPDLAKSRELQTKAGKSSGFGFETIWWNTANGPQVEVLRVQLAKSGIDLKSTKMDVATYSARNRACDWQAQMRSGSPLGIFEPETYGERYVSRTGAFKACGFSDDRFEELLSKSRGTVNAAERAKSIAEMNKIFADSWAWIPLFYAPQEGAQRKYVKGVVLHPEGYTHLRNAWLDK